MAPQYSRGSASADGIGKVYMGREIAKVMTYHGAHWLERAEPHSEGEDGNEKVIFATSPCALDAARARALQENICAGV